MTRRPRSPQEPDARQTILEAAVTLLRRGQGSNITTNQVAAEAGCAKGLVHYHFKRKDQLLAAAADRLWQQRTTAWTSALASGSARNAIGKAWDTLATESRDGTAASCATLGLGSDKLVVQSVNAGRAEFSRRIADALSQLLASLGLAPSVPVRELGVLLAATVEGIELQLGSGGSAEELEPAWSAFWAGLLSLTGPLRA